MTHDNDVDYAIHVQLEETVQRCSDKLRGLLSMQLATIHCPLSLQEHLSMVRNNLRDLHGDVAQLPNLRALNCRHNKLRNASIPPGLFELDDLSVVDFSNNQLKSVPEDLAHAKNLLVLNLSHNEWASLVFCSTCTVADTCAIYCIRTLLYFSAAKVSFGMIWWRPTQY